MRFSSCESLRTRRNADFAGISYPSKDTVESNYVSAKEVSSAGWYWWDNGHPQNPIVVKIGRKTKRHALREMCESHIEQKVVFGRTVLEMSGHWQYIPQPKSEFWERVQKEERPLAFDQ